MKTLKWFFILLIATGLPSVNAVKAQTYFSPSAATGCSEANVYFSNLLTSNYQPVFWQTTGYTYSWNFGNGQSSILKQPDSVSYTAPGDYTVRYQVNIDTVGFFLTSIHIFAIGCDDPNIWPFTNNPDIYIQLFDGSGTMILNTFDQADDNTTDPNNPDVTFTMNIWLNNPPYQLRVMDKDSGDSDDNCIDGAEHNGTTPLYFPANDASTFGNSSLVYNNNQLGFSASYFKPVITYIDSAVISIDDIPEAPLTNYTDSSFCNPSVVPDLVASGSNINWYANQELTQHLHTGNTFPFTYTSLGQYTFYATQLTAAGCESAAAIVNVEISELQAPVVLPNNQKYCLGELLPDIVASGNDIYWYSDSTLTTVFLQGNILDIKYFAPGQYTYYVVEQNQIQACTSDVVKVSFTINELEILPSGSDLSCYKSNDGVAEVEILTGKPPYQYSWSNSQTTQNINNLQTGEYAVVVVDGNFCLQMASVFIQEPDSLYFTSEVTESKCNRSEGSILLQVFGGTPPYSFLWTDNSTQQDRTAIDAGKYEVMVSDYNQCHKSARFVVDNACLNVPGLITPNGDGVNDVWAIENIFHYPDVIVEVFDRWGKKVFNSKGYPEPWDGTYNGKTLPSASYFYVINYNNSFNEPLRGIVDIVK